ncbi:MAG TPA: 4Fe-4S dicluster domain-containing protein [Deltaproteobacteria bacterium]|nr:4Fe-4S dicluster domain-containing protein [Deltaproteobacteria bacterium]
MKRRTFLGTVAYGAVLASMGALPALFARLLAPLSPAMAAVHLLRPPGALKDDDAFVGACIGCGNCAEVCPPRCIMFHKSDGRSEVNTPYINPAIKACILCMKCMDVCPTDALTRIGLEEIDMGVAQIDRSACYPWVDRGVCGACAAVCPLGSKGIDFAFANMYRPVVQSGCVGCGLCVEVCPHPSLPIRILDSSKRRERGDAGDIARSAAPERGLDFHGPAPEPGQGGGRQERDDGGWTPSSQGLLGY